MSCNETFFYVIISFDLPAIKTKAPLDSTFLIPAECDFLWEIVFCFTSFYIFIGISRTSGTMAENQCMQVLNPYVCNLSWCRMMCAAQHHGIGYCPDDYPHKCVCVYNCPR